MKTKILALALLLSALVAPASAQMYMGPASESRIALNGTGWALYCKIVPVEMGRGQIRIQDGVVYPYPNPSGTQLDGVVTVEARSTTLPTHRSGFVVWIDGASSHAGMSFYGIDSNTASPAAKLVLRDGNLTGSAMNTAPTTAPLTPGVYDKWGYWNTTCQELQQPGGFYPSFDDDVMAPVPQLPSAGVVIGWNVFAVAGHQSVDSPCCSGANLLCQVRNRGGSMTAMTTLGTFSSSTATSTHAIQWKTIPDGGGAVPWGPDRECSVYLSYSPSEGFLTYGTYFQ